MTLIVVMVILATMLVVAEVLFPSFGVLSLLAIGAYATAVIEAFDLGRVEGYATLGFCLVVAPAAVVSGFQILKHTSFGTRLILVAPEAAEVSARGADLRLRNYVGRDGVTASPMRPSGEVDFGNDRVDAVSDGGFIESGTRVRAVLVEGNRLVVEPIEEDGPPTAR